MKKSILTFGLVLAASLVQAASLNWKATGIKTPADSTVAGSGYTVLLFITEQSKDFGATVTTTSDVTDLADQGKFDDLVDLAAAQGSSSTAGGITGATGFNGNNFAGGDSLKAFAMVIDSDQKNYFITGEASASWSSSTGAQTLGFGSQASKTYSPFGNSEPDDPDQPIPEPATGALALAGVALLFRRRR